MTDSHAFIAFEGNTMIGTGDLAAVALAARASAARGNDLPILVFDSATSESVELDLRGSEADVLRRLPTPAPAAEKPRGPGRPKLGVTAREITLLPRHWDWLNRQPGGASVALRKLVEHSMRANADKDTVRTAQNAAYRFMSVMAGDRVGFEDAARALFAGDGATLRRISAQWPADISQHLLTLASAAITANASAA